MGIYYSLVLLFYLSIPLQTSAWAQSNGVRGIKKTFLRYGEKGFLYIHIHL